MGNRLKNRLITAALAALAGSALAAAVPLSAEFTTTNASFRWLGLERLIHTTTMMGEVVAMGASLCVQHDCNPRAVGQKHLTKLRHLAEMGIPWI